MESVFTKVSFFSLISYSSVTYSRSIEKKKKKKIKSFLGLLSDFQRYLLFNKKAK